MALATSLHIYNFSNIFFKYVSGGGKAKTTEGSSIEFIGYRILWYEQNSCTVLFTRH